VVELSFLLAQQGQFPKFVGIYCCAIPLAMVIALAGVYFGVRWYASRHNRE
jgi:hypothetical protein